MTSVLREQEPSGAEDAGEESVVEQHASSAIAPQAHQQDEIENTTEMMDVHPQHPYSSLEPDELPLAEQDDTFAALSSLDPAAFYGHHQDPHHYQSDEPRPLSGNMHQYPGNYSLI